MHRRNCIGPCALVVLVLSGCSGWSATSPMSSPVWTAQAIHDRIGEIGKMADRIIGTDLVVTASPVPLPTERFPATCAGDSCSAVTPDGALAYDAVAATTFTPEQDSRAVGIRHGVNLRATTGSDETFGVIDFRGLGGWLKHSVFSSDRSTFTVGVRWVGAASAGLHTGTNPESGTLTWTGAMTGLDKLSDRDPLVGDVTANFDMARQVIDLDFTNIATFDRGRKYDDMHWHDVRVVNGRFIQEDTRNPTERGVLSGYFYGPDHEELGGIFEHNHIVGAFGANRE